MRKTTFDKILDPKTPGNERKDLWLEEYLRMGLKLNKGKRAESAKWLGISIRTLRIYLNEKFPELKEEFPTPNTTARFHLNKPEYYWLGKKKEKLQKEYDKLNRP